jgi:WD40 repeat protein
MMREVGNRTVGLVMAESACKLALAFVGAIMVAAGVIAQPPAMGTLRDIGISSDGKLAFAGDDKRVIRVWDVPNRKLLRAIKEPQLPIQNTTFYYAFSADGKHCVVGNQRGFRAGRAELDGLDPEPLTFWHLSTGVKLRAFDLKDQPVDEVALSPDGKSAASVSLCKVGPGERATISDELSTPVYYYALRLWDTSNGKLIRTLLESGPVGPVANQIGPIAFSPDGKFLANAQFRGERGSGQWALAKWDAVTGKSLGAIDMAKQWAHMEIRHIAFSPDAKTVAVGQHSGIGLWDVDTGKPLWYHDTAQVIDRAVIDFWRPSFAAFSSDGKKLVISGDTGWLSKEMRAAGKTTRGGMVVLDAVTGKKTTNFAEAKEWTRSVRFMPANGILVGASTEGVRVWDAETGRHLFDLPGR